MVVADKDAILHRAAYLGLPTIAVALVSASPALAAEYASASLTNWIWGQTMPNHLFSIATDCGQEDHVSMGSIGGRKALKVVENVEKIIDDKGLAQVSDESELIAIVHTIIQDNDTTILGEPVVIPVFMKNLFCNVETLNSATSSLIGKQAAAFSNG